MYVDPDLNVYRALEMKRSWNNLMNPSIIGHTRRAIQAGHKQGRVQGDVKQLGGVVLLGTEGQIYWRHQDNQAGDHAELEQALKVARSL